MKLREMPQVMALSTADKLDLIDQLWMSIEPELDSVEVSEEEKKLLDDRWETFLANPESALTLDKVRRILRAREKLTGF